MNFEILFLKACNIEGLGLKDIHNRIISSYAYTFTLKRG